MSGNIRINLNMMSDAVLNEDDFNFFYHLEEISGALFLQEFPQTIRIILPNLRIIRGEELMGGLYAMVLEDVNINEFILPRLTEISRGSVKVSQPTGRRWCNLTRVNWDDIIDNGDIFDSCINPMPHGMLY